eukprot:XP_001697578.1 target of rapamycin, growth-regulatory PI3K-like protein kinase [Chlamydomonas reinhardtii]
MMLSGVGPVPTKPAFKAGGDTLSRHLEELCRSGAWERRHKDGDKALLEYIEAEARDLSVEAFGRLMTDVYQRIGNMLLKGNDITRRMGGVLAIDELIDVKLSGDDAAKTARLSGLLSRVLEESEDPVLSESASHTLGHLVRSGGAMTSDIVEKEIRRSLAWCDPRNEPNESRRLTALLVLTEAAESAPAVFNVHVKSFIDAVWFPLRDAKQHIREAAVRALKACLCLVEKRETRYRVQWYYKLHEQTMRGMKRDHRTGALPSPESIHGSLLALAELLQHTGEFMLARYKEVVENVFRYKDSKEKNIRRAVIHLLPRMAAFSPERFASEYLARAIAFLLIVLKNPPERGAAFAALADMAAALARVNCAAGVSEVLVQALTQVANALPELLEDIQYQLLDLLSLVLSKRPFNSSTTQPKFAALSAAIAAGELQGNALTKLALQTLGTFDLGGIQLLEFMRDHILAYTDDPDKEIRQAAADCLRALFVGMNDESVAVRGLAIRLVGRLAERNPAHVNPALRKHLLQLLHDMEFSPDNRAREESAFLLEVLITAAARLIMPYVSPIQKALAKAAALQRDLVNENNVIKTVLSTLGALAEVSGTTFRPFISEVMPLVIEAIQDNSDGRRRVVAVKTLGFIVSSCGNVMGPYLEYPQLLSVLLRMLHEGHPAQRREVIKVLGIIGPGDDGGPGGDLLPSSGLVTSSEDYYPTVAINALMRVLRDPALASQHLAVIRALAAIFRALQLSVVLPILLGVLRGGDEALREEILASLRALVGYVRQHMRRFLPDLTQLVHEFWPAAPRTCLALIADLGMALRDDIRCVLDGHSDEQLRRDALDTICAVAVCLGPEFAIFVPTIRKACQRHRLHHEWFDRLAGKSSHRVTKEDWAEWMRNFAVELLKESPSPALRACHGLAQVHPSMARELFAAGFVSCWAELEQGLQEQLVRSLEAALASPTIPPETVTALLNLAEFMEHDDKRLPLDTRTLGALAEKCHAFAKALHYKELEFQTSPQSAIEALIHINNQLRQPEAAVGVLAYAQKHLHMELKEGWYEKLCRWDEALDAYERRLLKEAPGSMEYHTLLRYNPMNITQAGNPGYGAGSGAPHVMLAFLKHLWTQGNRTEAYNRIKDLEASRLYFGESNVEGMLNTLLPLHEMLEKAGPTTLKEIAFVQSYGRELSEAYEWLMKYKASRKEAELHQAWDLYYHVFKRINKQLHSLTTLELQYVSPALVRAQKLDNPGVIAENLASFRAATEHAPNWAKAWHQWALFNVAVSAHYSVALGQAAGDRTGNLQDILRLLTLWFNFGAYAEVRAALTEGFQLVSIDTWLLVIPQIIARIHTHNTDVRQLIHHLLVKIGRHHPQALMYPLLVATKSQSPARRQAAYSVLECIRQHSAALVEQAQLGLELAVPGTYIAGEPLVTIAAFAPQLHVISSKQRPRKLTIHGGDGAEYMFLLKGHEDLRQDERVMQLFGLVNTMLAHDRITAERDLSIARYAVIPLSPNSGLIGWVPNCDTLHALIREYRCKVEVFEYALDSTSGEDLHKSRNSEVWLDRRTNYTRSAAVMSMVGYILGLGDRHPSNLMLDRYSGKLLHIDFGDCFEASMNREKFPEKVPFRLTRMMIKAMEVSGIEGNFRTTCENVMRVLRSNKESVTAMLEAFTREKELKEAFVNLGDANEVGRLINMAVNHENLCQSYIGWCPFW